MGYEWTSVHTFPKYKTVVKVADLFHKSDKKSSLLDANKSPVMCYLVTLLCNEITDLAWFRVQYLGYESSHDFELASQRACFWSQIWLKAVGSFCFTELKYLLCDTPHSYVRWPCFACGWAHNIYSASHVDPPTWHRARSLIKKVPHPADHGHSLKHKADSAMQLTFCQS